MVSSSCSGFLNLFAGDQTRNIFTSNTHSRCYYDSTRNWWFESRYLDESTSLIDGWSQTPSSYFRPSRFSPVLSLGTSSCWGQQGLDLQELEFQLGSSEVFSPPNGMVPSTRVSLIGDHFCVELLGRMSHHDFGPLLHSQDMFSFVAGLVTIRCTSRNDLYFKILPALSSGFAHSYWNSLLTLSRSFTSKKPWQDGRSFLTHRR